MRAKKIENDIWGSLVLNSLLASNFHFLAKMEKNMGETREKGGGRKN